MLYPRASESRTIVDLCGLWAFRKDPCDLGQREGWARSGIPCAREMPVPASYNDLSMDASLRDHIGWVWYEREVYVPAEWRQRHVELRFDAVAHHAKVYWNGELLAEHRGGFLPFTVDLDGRCVSDGPNRLVVAVGNELDWSTLPPGEVIVHDDDDHPPGWRRQVTHFDFFHYSGIHRPVRLVVTPRQRLQRLRIDTDVVNGVGIVRWQATVSGGEVPLRLELHDPAERIIATGTGNNGEFRLEAPVLWEPGHGGLHLLVIRAGEDVYRQPIGIRSITVKDGKFLINERPFTFRGFGKHEDAPLVGRGLDLPTMTKDLELLRWIGANSFRTSHYPYAEEWLDAADRLGIVIIDEAPAVGLWDHGAPVFVDGKVGEATLRNHLEDLEALIERDANHPCVVLWSLANEPACWEAASRPYFERVVARARELDPTRPLTIVHNTTAARCQVSDLVDVIGLNRYAAWYSDPGRLELVGIQLTRDLEAWWEREGKPIIICEYGADTIAGMHQEPPVMFTEEFQRDFLAAYHDVFDGLPYVVGEHVWNFADFQTKQGITRIDGNKKGVFTRDRRPKLAAQLLRARWRTAGGRLDQLSANGGGSWCAKHARWCMDS